MMEGRIIRLRTQEKSILFRREGFWSDKEKPQVYAALQALFYGSALPRSACGTIVVCLDAPVVEIPDLVLHQG